MEKNNNQIDGKTFKDRINAMNNIFYPRSIAFVGASNNPGKWGFLIPHTLVMGKYKGKIYPVNPREKEIMGYKAYPSILDIPDDIDLVVFTIPAQGILASIKECIQKKIKAGLVIPAGFAELGEEGKKMQDEIASLARENGMVLVGPNSQGISCPSSGVTPWMPIYLPKPGAISIVSQSGNLLTWIGQGLEEYGFGIAKGISVGNAMDLNWQDYLLYLEQDEDTKVIVLYIEGVEDGRTFLELTKRVNRKKPIVVLKGGSTQAGLKAAKSHTGAMAGNDEIFDAVCRQAGLIRVNTVIEAVCISAGLVASPLPKGNRLGIITFGGGMGVLASDMCHKLDIELPELSEKTQKQLKQILPPWWVPGNPVDMVAGIGYAMPDKVIPILIENNDVDGVLLIGFGWLYSSADIRKHSPFASVMDLNKIVENRTKSDREYCQTIGSFIKEKNFPILINSQVAHRAIDNNFVNVVEMLEDNIMLYPSIELAIQAFAAMSRYRSSIDT